ncbi:hypothetical protein [Herbiconiux daphne]|uniref:SPOR domain-containing protein n=1 Tax=Herbiconiux daphne TaxID=2970914 RepID=A0ABT2GY99_9MICO|nr:hypothetical protein [Herbiconiux daphne]MCS5732936.1 hypothetical protein [Herbiconiux daphne]
MTDLRIVEHEQDDIVTYYVATDLNPDEFPGAPSLGPFDTREEAEAAIAEWDQELIDDATPDDDSAGAPAL